VPTRTTTSKPLSPTDETVPDRPARGRPKTSSKERIRAAAKKLFAKHGYEGASIDEIARVASVSKPTLYAHFGSKERLFLEILEAAGDNIVAPFFGPETDGRPIEDVLLDHARTYARVLLTPEMLALNRLIVAEAHRFPDMARRYYAAGPEIVYSAIASFLKKRVAAREIACSDCMAAARMYGAMIVSPTRLRLNLLVDTNLDWAKVDQQSALAVQIFVNGLKKNRGA
jgi:TetR/AcrR family transcriptional repressor of mexJK operon